MNRNWPYRYCNWPHQYRNWPYRYTDYSTPFAVNQSMQSLEHIECSTRNPNQYIFLVPCEVPTVFVPYINFSCQSSSFFSQCLKRLSADHLRCDHRCFYMVTSIWLVSYILAELGPGGKLLKKQTSFLVQPHAWLVRIVLWNFPSLFRLPQSCLQASRQRTTLGHF